MPAAREPRLADRSARDERECHRLADQVLELAIDCGLALPAASATWALAQLDLALGRWEQALVRLLALEEIRPGFGHPMLTVITGWDRVEAAVRVERLDVAERSIERSRRGRRRQPTLGGRRAGGLPGARGQPEAAEGHFEAALGRSPTPGRWTAPACTCTTASICGVSVVGSTPAATCVPPSRASSGSGRPMGRSGAASCGDRRRPANATPARSPS